MKGIRMSFPLINKPIAARAKIEKIATELVEIIKTHHDRQLEIEKSDVVLEYHELHSKIVKKLKELEQ